MEKMGATVSQAEQTNNPDITGAPTQLRNSHVPSLLAQEYSCWKRRDLSELDE